MPRRSRRASILLLGGTVALVIVLGAIWAVAPEDVRGLLLLAWAVLTVTVYLALFVVQRRCHWGR